MKLVSLACDLLGYAELDLREYWQMGQVVNLPLLGAECDSL